MCPDPWRIPSLTDFANLIANSTLAERTTAFPPAGDIYAGGNSIMHSSYGWFWSSAGSADKYPFICTNENPATIWYYNEPYYGFPVYCVK
jgi:hypothetical protein